VHKMLFDLIVEAGGKCYLLDKETHEISGSDPEIAEAVEPHGCLILFVMFRITNPLPKKRKFGQCFASICQDPNQENRFWPP